MSRSMMSLLLLLGIEECPGMRSVDDAYLDLVDRCDEAPEMRQGQIQSTCIAALDDLDCDEPLPEVCR